MKFTREQSLVGWCLIGGAFLLGVSMGSEDMLRKLTRYEHETLRIVVGCLGVGLLIAAAIVRQLLSIQADKKPQ